MLRALDGRERFDVERDRGAVSSGESFDVLPTGGHRSADRIAVGHVAGLENALDVPLRVIADAGLRDVGDPTVTAFRVGAAGEAGC